MSGIYISGMEMPRKGHTVTITILPSGEACVDHYDCRPQLTVPILYNAISVPDHGRLGDLDALVGQMQHNLFEIEDKAEKELGFDETLRRGMQYGHAVCVDAVNDAPTIIPASGEKECERK